ncbi:hypothetical protein [Prochlorococcus marinus]|uniref:hypothetical protein n=1 Tax=Prochlorococcus marinus TaxID=1219 RepID=UPI0022B5CFCA|nr:hypothetical protein [Prochlorococcus marinus]
MSENNLNRSNPETANHHWFPFLRYKKECEAAGKETSINEWMRATGQLDAKIAHEESVALAAKLAEEKEADAKKAIEKETEERKTALKKDMQQSTKSISENESAKN